MKNFFISNHVVIIAASFLILLLSKDVGVYNDLYVKQQSGSHSLQDNMRTLGMSVSYRNAVCLSGEFENSESMTTLYKIAQKRASVQTQKDDFCELNASLVRERNQIRQDFLTCDTPKAWHLDFTPDIGDSREEFIFYYDQRNKDCSKGRTNIWERFLEKEGNLLSSCFSTLDRGVFLGTLMGDLFRKFYFYPASSSEKKLMTKNQLVQLEAQLSSDSCQEQLAKLD